MPPAVPPGGPSVHPLATASLVCAALMVPVGLFTLVLALPLAVVAVILGIVAMHQISRSEGRQTGRGLAVAGIVGGGLGLLAVGFLVLLAVQLFTGAL